jgi:hypothetical protein
MPADSLEDVLVRVRSLLIDLERHVDRAAAERDLAQVARAWVRAAQVERLLRGVLPEDVAADVPDVGEPELHTGHGSDDDDQARGPTTSPSG